MAKEAEVGEVNNGNDETVKRSSSKKLNVPTGYLTSLRSKKISFPRWFLAIVEALS